MSVKIPAAKKHLDGLIRLNFEPGSRLSYLRLDMNESPNGLPAKVLRETISGVDANFLSTYPTYTAFENQLARFLKLKPDQVCLANGSDAAIKYIFDAYVSPGDRVLLTDPTFAMYSIYCRTVNAKAVSVSYHSDLSFPVDGFLKALNPATKLAVIVDPNNPTGSVISPCDLERILKKAALYGTMVLVDEAYHYFYPRTAIPLIRKFPNLVVIRTFSKLCGLASVRLGFAVATPEVILNLKRVKPTFDVNGVSILLAGKLIGVKGLIPCLIRNARAGRNFLSDCLQKAGIPFVSGQANFILIDCGNRVPQIIIALRKRKILVSGGFRQPFLKNYLRVTVGDVALMRKFWNAFITIWSKKK